MRFSLPFLACLALVSSVTASASAQPAPALRDADKANDFNFAMYGALRTEKGNFFFSGTSMREAFNTAYLGARAETATQLAAAFRYDKDPAKSAELMKMEIADFATDKGSANLAIANRLWFDTQVQPKSAFTTLAQSSSFERVDFAHAPEPARITINGWVASHTNDRIKDLLPSGSVDSHTRLVITNAVWFKGDWASAFPVAATREDSFWVDGTTATKTAMMHQTNGFQIARSDGATLLEMPYSKSDIALDVLLPDAKDGLSAVEDEVVAGGISKWTSRLMTQSIDVSFPKVTFTWGKSIKDPLKKLGVFDPFNPSRADFRGIAEGRNLFVADAIHEAFVAIDEKGTEAAAATAITLAPATTALHAQPFVFHADHPFIVILRDVKQNRVLFTGRVTNPKS